MEKKTLKMPRSKKKDWKIIFVYLYKIYNNKNKFLKDTCNFINMFFIIP